MVTRRDHEHDCGLAAGLDVVGERWTLLVVRELLIGPARFTALLANTPGIGPDLLSDRLRTLVEHGVAEQVPTADGDAICYRLTDVGEQLRHPLLGLARWGLGLLGEQDRAGATRAEWGFLAVQSMVVRDAVPDVDDTYEFRVDEQVFVIEVRAGDVRFRRGAASDPNMTVECDANTFVRVGARMLSPSDAVLTGDVQIKGDPDATQRCIHMLGLG
jgi:DNA-binding HxlR family transcriptional regulator